MDLVRIGGKFEDTCVIFARATNIETNTDIWQAIVARATESLKNCSNLTNLSISHFYFILQVNLAAAMKAEEEEDVSYVAFFRTGLLQRISLKKTLLQAA